MPNLIPANISGYTVSCLSSGVYGIIEFLPTRVRAQRVKQFVCIISVVIIVVITEVTRFDNLGIWQISYCYI